MHGEKQRYELVANREKLKAFQQYHTCDLQLHVILFLHHPSLAQTRVVLTYV